MESWIDLSSICPSNSFIHPVTQSSVSVPQSLQPWNLDFSGIWTQHSCCIWLDLARRLAHFLFAWVLVRHQPASPSMASQSQASGKPATHTRLPLPRTRTTGTRTRTRTRTRSMQYARSTHRTAQHAARSKHGAEHCWVWARSGWFPILAASRFRPGPWDYHPRCRVYIAPHCIPR